MNLPNKLTILRIILTFVFICFLFSEWFFAKYLALLIFTLACLTDYYDGYIARKRGLISNFGKLMDPVADKILLIAAFLAFVALKIVPLWMVVVIIFREVGITGMRLVMISRGNVLAAENWGKYKTVSQMLTIFVILIFLALKETLLTYSQCWNLSCEVLSRQIIFILMWITVILTLVSGFLCLWRNRRLFNANHH